MYTAFRSLSHLIPNVLPAKWPQIRIMTVRVRCATPVRGPDLVFCFGNSSHPTTGRWHSHAPDANSQLEWYDRALPHELSPIRRRFAGIILNERYDSMLSTATRIWTTFSHSCLFSQSRAGWMIIRKMVRNTFYCCKESADLSALCSCYPSYC